MDIYNLEKLGATLYQTYRTQHEKGYPITREFIAELESTKLDSLRNSFMNERKKYETGTIFEHNETFWAMYDELQ